MSTVLNNLGYALMRRERPRDAALIYTLALRVHPGSAATLANLALACGAARGDAPRCRLGGMKLRPSVPPSSLSLSGTTASATSRARATRASLAEPARARARADFSPLSERR